MNESVLITGANAGLGKETARQFALRQETKRVILFCRNRARAAAAKKELEESTGKRFFEIVIGDVTDAESVRRVVEDIRYPIDAGRFECRWSDREIGCELHAFRHESISCYEHSGQCGPGG